MPKIKTPVEPRRDKYQPVLGIRDAVQWTSENLPRMQWMSELVLDKIDANQELINDPLSVLPPSAKKVLLELPKIAWITVGLFVIDTLFMLTLITLTEFGFVYRWFTTLLLTLAMFVMFSVSHDAAHGSISNISWVNGIIGRISFPFLGPGASFPLFRYIHQMHHKHTNHPVNDPDRFCSHGNSMFNNPLFIPLRCLVLSGSYFVFYVKHVPNRPKLEVLEVSVFIAIQLGILFEAYSRGYGYAVFSYYIIPGILSHGLLGFFFDFIPHHHEEATTPIENRYRTTSMLQTYWFLQPVLSLLLQYQDYHLIHHLYPTIPFYRYADKWREKQDFLKEKQVTINHLTVEEVVKTTKQKAASISSRLPAGIKVQ